MIKLSRFFYRKSSIPIALIFTVAMILYASIVMGSQSECVTSYLSDTQTLPGLSFGYNETQILALLNKLDLAALSCYLRLLLVWDNIFPLIYGFMYIFWLSVIYKRLIPDKIIPLNIYPAIPVVLDWVENFFEAQIVRTFMENGNTEIDQIFVASFITQSKWIASSGNYVLIIIGAFILFGRKFLRRKTQK